MLQLKVNISILDFGMNLFLPCIFISALHICSKSLFVEISDKNKDDFCHIIDYFHLSHPAWL